ncbi:MAG: CopD family protein [Chitinophagaceae bacterium]
MYNYIKALHIIFVVTWFSGLFYVVRLFIYNTEAGEKSLVEKTILRRQFNIMIRRLWYGITWPSAILTLIFGGWMLYLYGSVPPWLRIKLGFVLALLIYHLTLQRIFKLQMKDIFQYSSQQLRIWNEMATVFLIAIVLLAVVKQGISVIWGMIGLILFVIILIATIRIYKILRKK